MSIVEQNIKLFEELINCPLPAKMDSCTIGITRRGELKEYVQAVMNKWVQQFPSVEEIAKMPADIKQKFIAQRFCTYNEYDQLFSQPRNSNYDSPIFILLGINDEQARKRVTNLLPQSMDGYFGLMENLNAALQAFFFSARLNQDS